MSRQTFERSPVHVVYGGADRFNAGTVQKLGTIALKSLQTYAPNFVDFANTFSLSGSDALPTSAQAISELSAKLERSASRMRMTNPDAYFAWTIYQRTIQKLRTEPIEDFRIDFEDGYGFRTDEEEDADAASASAALAKTFTDGTITNFCGFRIKSLAPETSRRAVRTLELFIDNFLVKTGGSLPSNFVVTLPKVSSSKDVKALSERLSKIEKKLKLQKRAIGIELMAETPRAIFDTKGRTALPKLIKAADGRCRSVHFGAYDYTAMLGISGAHQRLDHPACDLARQLIQVSIATLGIRMSDSVTTQIPVPIHSGSGLTSVQRDENRRAVRAAWKTHFDNVSRSMSSGFYQSWDLHPNQLVARYAAVFTFFLESMDGQGERLRSFIDRSTQATLTGNTFDDAASAQGLMNFFRMGLDCGALTEKEVKASTGLSAEQVRSDFRGLTASRRP